MGRGVSTHLVAEPQVPLKRNVGQMAPELEDTLWFKHVKTNITMENHHATFMGKPTNCLWPAMFKFADVYPKSN